MSRTPSAAAPLLPGTLALLALTAALLGPAAARAEVALFVGARGCQACHGSAPRDHYHDWLAGKHARAFEALRGKEKTDPACLSCHGTGQGGLLAPGVTAKDLLGVQCEACHGPGSLYRPQAVMKDREAAVAHGLVIPSRKTCLKCHR